MLLYFSMLLVILVSWLMNGKEDKEPEIIELERVWYMEWYGAMIDISRDIDVNIRSSKSWNGGVRRVIHQVRCHYQTIVNLLTVKNVTQKHDAGINQK